MAESYSIYCDESCHLLNSDPRVMVLGCVWCLTDRIPEISNRLRDIKREFGLIGDGRPGASPSFELKWHKVSPAKADYYLRVVDYFFDDDDLHFRGVVIPDKTLLRHGQFGQDHDTWYYKMCFRMLEQIIDPEHRYRVYLDIKDTRSEAKRKSLEEVLRSARYDPHGQIVERVQQIRSHESELMQVADLLMGAVCYANRGLDSSPAKRRVIDRIARRFGRPLTRTTWLQERKVNLLVWQAAGTLNA